MKDPGAFSLEVLARKTATPDTSDEHSLCLSGMPQSLQPGHLREVMGMHGWGEGVFSEAAELYQPDG